MNELKKIRLFDELIISEYSLSEIISKYIFPRKYYENELRKISVHIPRNEDDFKKTIINNKDKICFRTKNIIFIGFDNKENYKYYFLQLTTKHKNFRQSLYFKHLTGHKVYINTNKMFYFNFLKQKVWYSKFNNDKRFIIQNIYWKVDLVNNMNTRLIKSLVKKTNLKIYKRKLEEYKNHKSYIM